MKKPLMETPEDASASFPQHSPEHRSDRALSGMNERQLAEKIRALENEVTALRKELEDKKMLEGLVTQLRDANQNLVLATVNAQTHRDEAEATNRRQNEFLAMLAHELRNPLAPISMAAALLERIPGASAQLQHLHETISRQVGHMAHLLDDLLDAARINSGKITLSMQPVLLSDVIERTIETIQPRIDERRQQLKIHVPAQAIMLEGDSVRLTQVLANLLANAFKYTNDFGEITLRASPDDENVVITVEDNGVGIAPEVMPHIFDLFTQGPRSLARSEGGLGVGLNVVRNLVHMHGGRVEASSMGLGKGSIFTVTIPVCDKMHTVSTPPSRPRGAGAKRRILLIEDNVDACDTLKSLLELEGYASSAAYDGNSGLAKARADEYDFLICDIGLPGLNGFEVIREIRKSAHGVKPYAIALSGYGQVEDRNRAIAAGFNEYCVKPVRPDVLLSILSSEEFDN